MDPRFLGLYNRELEFIREMGAEFAQEHPRIARRLGLSDVECADPYVERLLEGFAFLAARVRLKMDAEFPRFTRHLLELVYPHYLAPVPSMAVVQFHPDPGEGTLSEGYALPRQTVLRTLLGKGDQTACEYRTAHEVVLWPIEIAEAEYLTTLRDLSDVGAAALQGARAAVRIRLRAKPGWTFDRLALSKLALYLPGAGELPVRLYEQLLANPLAVVVRPGRRPAPWTEVASRMEIRRVGFADSEALLPQGPRSFQGYRLLQEYFAFPQRFAFVEIGGLAPAVRRCKDAELELTIVLDRNEPLLHNVVTASSFALFCTPAANLFPKPADNIPLDEQRTEYHLLPDRTRPVDFEVYQVSSVVGTGTGAAGEIDFRPFYSRREAETRDRHRAYYVVNREPRVLSEQQRKRGTRSTYVGSEAFLSIVDADEAPYSPDLRQLQVDTLCTNRDLPLFLTVGSGRTDFTLLTGAPVESVRCIVGPTRPRPSAADGEIAWRLIGHLSLNYLSLAEGDGPEGAAAVREMLALYGATSEDAFQRQVEGIRTVRAVPITRRIHTPGMISLGRGLELTVTFDESGFAGSGPFVLGAVLEEFFARYVSINSFTETVVTTLDRGELIRWPARTGRRHAL